MPRPRPLSSLSHSPGRLSSRQSSSSNGFHTTDWSVLARLDTPEFADALAKLCQQYWYPVYAFIRRRTSDTHRAEDLTQVFFCKVISLQTFRMADRERGRFRAFLLTAVKNFLASEYQASQAQKRGGDRDVFSLDFAVADQMYRRNRTSQSAPEQEFDRAWALSLLEQAIDRLREESEAQGDRLRFELFVPSLRSSSLDYPSVATQLGISEVAARKAVSRFRACYGQHLRNAIASTLADEDSIEEEVDWILNVLKDN